jgi:hypothetical protein
MNFPSRSMRSKLGEYEGRYNRMIPNCEANARTKGTAQIAAKICSKDPGQRTWARSNTHWPYRITLSHWMGLTCSRSVTSIFSSSSLG